MRLAYLPPELLRGIIVNLSRHDLASACRTSRSFLGVALPVLYRDIGDFERDQHGIPATQIVSAQEEKIRENGEEQPEESDSSDETETPSVVAPRQPPRATVWETLERHPEWSTHVRMVLLRLDTSTDEARTLLVLASFSFLNRLHVIDAASKAASPDICDHLMEQCPRSITMLILLQSDLSSSGVLRLLGRLSLLESVVLGGGKSFRFDSSTLSSPDSSLNLPRLRALGLWFLEWNRALFATIAKACPTLTTLSVDTHSLVTLDHQYLPTILHLTIVGRLSRVEDSNEIVHVLDSCVSLEAFVLAVSVPSSGPDNVERLETVQALHRLPQSLRRVEVTSIPFNPAYLLDFLSSGSRRLRNVKLFRPTRNQRTGTPLLFDVVVQGKIEDVCAKRNIRMSWIEEN